jgi:hypothetical protein
MLFIVDSSGVPSVAKMVQVVADIPAPTDNLIFANGFESGTFEGWSRRSPDGRDLRVARKAALEGNYGLLAEIDDNNNLSVLDNRPNAEPRYYARFRFDLNGITMAEGDVHDLFRGVAGGLAGSWPVVKVNLRFYSGSYQLRVGLLNDGTTWRYTKWFSVTDAPYLLELDWRAATAPGANNGSLTFWIDGVARPQLTGIDNDTRRIDSIRLGPTFGLDSGTRGTYFFDAFESRRPAAILANAAVGIAAAEETEWTEEEMMPEDVEEERNATPRLFLPLLNR